jgi:hypothetical protein
MIVGTALEAATVCRSSAVRSAAESIAELQPRYPRTPFLQDYQRVIIAVSFDLRQALQWREANACEPGDDSGAIETSADAVTTAMAYNRTFGPTWRQDFPAVADRLAPYVHFEIIEADSPADLNAALDAAYPKAGAR